MKLGGGLSLYLIPILSNPILPKKTLVLLNVVQFVIFNMHVTITFRLNVGIHIIHGAFWNTQNQILLVSFLIATCHFLLNGVMFVAFTSMQLQKFQPIGLFFQKT
jgi:hypothetical protein